MADQIEDLIKALKETANASEENDETLLDLVDKLEAHMEVHDQEIEEHMAVDVKEALLALEAELATDHPLATRVTEKVVELLANMGV